jgi:NAD(P)-dependent dehydrogenase (short-subunit alcohol dehydrogenase family)/acyl carrier protein
VAWPVQAHEAGPGAAAGEPGVWLLVGAADGLCAALLAQLQGCGQRSRQVDPGQADVWAEVLQSLHAEGGVRGVVQLAGVDGVQAVLPPAGRESWRTTLRLVQALLDAGAALPGGLWLVTRGAQAVRTGQAVPGLAHAPLWGLGRSLAREQAELGCRLVDLEPGAARDAEAAALVQELLAPGRDTQLAYRAGQRHVARLRRRAVPQAGTLSLDAQASYLVVGGLKGLGLQVAERLAERGARHLVLLGRGVADAAAQARLAALRVAGVQVLALQADISRREQLQQVLRQAGAALPPLKGVVDCAAVLRDGVLRNQDEASFEQVLAPKVQGAWNLHELTAGQPLAFFVLFSSMVAVVGAAGQTNYAAGNAFLDGLAQQRRSQGLPGLSVNWGAWAGSGLVAQQGLQQRLQAGGVTLIEPRQGLQWFEALVAAPAAQTGAQVAVAPIDWQRLGVLQSGAGSSFFDDVMGQQNEAAGAAAARSAAFLSRLRSASAPQRMDLFAAAVREQVAELLALEGPAQVKPHQRLFDLGLDSLLALELRTHLAGLLGVSLPSTLLFNYPTVAALAEYLVSVVPGLMEEDEPGTQPLAVAEADALDRLSDAEIERLLLDELDS